MIQVMKISILIVEVSVIMDQSFEATIVVIVTIIIKDCVQWYYLSSLDHYYLIDCYFSYSQKVMMYFQLIEYLKKNSKERCFHSNFNLQSFKLQKAIQVPQNSEKEFEKFKDGDRKVATRMKD